MEDRFPHITPQEEIEVENRRMNPVAFVVFSWLAVGLALAVWWLV